MTHDARHTTHGPKGVTLIIVVFAMMVLGVLGWTLSSMQATDFQINAGGNLDSERALYLAEAGAQYALTQLSLNGCWRTNGDCTGTNADCADAADWLSAHSISPGQYRVCCRQPVLGVESGDAVIESRGYVPQAAEPYRAMRQVKVIVQLGSLTKAVMTQAPDPDDQNIGLFDWSKASADHTITINGNINAGHYSGDGDANPDEAGQDYGTAPMLPPGAAGSQRDFTTAYPSINMQWFHDNANEVWPNRDIDFPVSSTINGIYLDNTPTPTNCIVVDDPNFFTDMDDQAIRLSVADLSEDNQDGWRRIRNLGNGGGITCCTGFPDDRCAQVRPLVPAAWTNGSGVKLMVRFGQGADNGSSGDILYIGQQRDGGQPMETILDVYSNTLSLGNRYIISEGNIYIKGPEQLTMGLSGGAGTTRYPRLATQAGNIVSLDTPSGATESAKVGQRIISGLIYSESGEVSLNYLRHLNTGSYQGNLVYGKQVTLDGRIRIDYLSNLVSTDGFTFAPGTASWEEE